MRILIATDAWTPQVNGVVRTLSETARAVEALGHEVVFASPEAFFTVPLPFYPQIRLALATASGLAQQVD
ncbi:MAG: glycosyltransferase family 1 protein, partial [Alphaproteobacteria bacterium]